MIPLLNVVRDYYEDKLRQHGPTPNGVDWNGPISQSLRFEALSRLVGDPSEDVFSVDDYGCGYGAFYAYLSEKKYSTSGYLGIDLSPEMVCAARRLYPTAAFCVGNSSPRIADYAVASGIFNVALDNDRLVWERYILDTLDAMNAATKVGFAFNCLTLYSDPEYMRSHLYYGDPCFLFDYCKRHYSKQVALLHDYGLYEFTIIVRKDL